ncbi:MAG: hypothetical protein QXI60_03935 [Thermofilaceae archaeon]
MSVNASPILEETTRAWLEAICPVGSHVKLCNCEYEVLGYTNEKVLVQSPLGHQLWLSLEQFEEQAELL